MELTRKVKLALDETRILILGAQILLAFSFAVLSAMATISSQIFYAIWIGEASPDRYRVGNALVTAVTILLAIGLAGDSYVVIAKIMGSPIVGLIAGSLALVFLIGLWHAFPVISASIQNRPGGAPSSLRFVFLRQRDFSARFGTRPLAWFVGNAG